MQPFIITYTGKKFTYDMVYPCDICIEDIAHALSQLCRYTGHTNTFYSVAQHCLLIADKIPGGPEVKLAALLHDAAEAYVNDLASPLKRWLMDREETCCPTDYQYLHDDILRKVYKKWGITRVPHTVEVFDLAACVFEAETFLNLTPEQLEECEFPVEYRGLWDPWNPEAFKWKCAGQPMEEVELMFKNRFSELMEEWKDECGQSVQNGNEAV